MELLILSKLKWDLSAITPYDFLEYLLRLLADDAETTEKATSVGQLLLEGETCADLRRHTENYRTRATRDATEHASSRGAAEHAG